MNTAAGRLTAIAMLVAGLAALALLPPLPSPKRFESFADTRTLLGIANCLNVVSNAAFLLVGVWGLHTAWRRPKAFIEARERLPCLVLFLSVILVSAGSAYYHLDPDDARLFWDRLPMGMGFMALLSVVLSDRIGANVGARMLPPLLLAGAASVVWWRWSTLRGAEDILPYAIVQFGSLAVIVLLMWRFPSRYTRGPDLLVAIAIYAAAKIAEVLDAQIYALTGVLSGHTLKHLLAALALAWLVRMLLLREPRLQPHGG